MALPALSCLVLTACNSAAAAALGLCRAALHTLPLSASHRPIGFDTPPSIGRVAALHVLLELDDAMVPSYWKLSPQVSSDLVFGRSLLQPA